MAVPQSFPAKIYQILENESPEIIQWNENGLSFRIVDHNRFEREIVPKYFRHNQISSVQRQLNLYGFKCISRGEYKRSFFHPKFKRGDWETVRKLTRYIPLKKSPLGIEEGNSSSAPPSTAPSQGTDRPSSGSTQPTYFPYIYPYGHSMPHGQGMPIPMHHPHFAVAGGSSQGPHWQAVSWHPTAHAVPSSTFALHAPGPHTGLPMAPSYAPGQTAMPSELASRLGFGPHFPTTATATVAEAAHAKESIKQDERNAAESRSSDEMSTSESPSSAPGNNISAVGEAHHSDTGHSALAVLVNPDYDLFDFGMFDGFHGEASPKTPLMPLNNYPLQRLPQAPPVSANIATAAAAAATAALSRALPHPTELPVLQLPAAVQTAAQLPMVTSTVAAKGVDVACNTELTYDAATNSFVLNAAF